MAKKSSGSSSSKAPKASSGKRRVSRWKKALRRIEMKIARFERYKSEGKAPAKKSKRQGWDTSGLEKHAELLQECIKKGPKRAA